jgi:hypothetical protein
MPIPQLIPKLTQEESKPEHLIEYAKYFERVAKDPNLKSFKNQLLQTAKNLREMAQSKLDNPYL